MLEHFGPDVAVVVVVVYVVVVSSSAHIPHVATSATTRPSCAFRSENISVRNQLLVMCNSGFVRVSVKASVFVCAWDPNCLRKPVHVIYLHESHTHTRKPNVCVKFVAQTAIRGRCC